MDSLDLEVQDDSKPVFDCISGTLLGSTVAILQGPNTTLVTMQPETSLADQLIASELCNLLELWVNLDHLFVREDLIEVRLVLLPRCI